MLRERRRHANFKPNRRLDRKSSRGMIYENEELRLRTININAEVERGQSDIRKLRRENEQLRREIWSLRDEYDRLNKLLRANRSTESCGGENNGNNSGTQDEESDSCDTCKEDDGEDDVCDESCMRKSKCEQEHNCELLKSKILQTKHGSREITENYENSQKSTNNYKHCGGNGGVSAENVNNSSNYYSNGSTSAEGDKLRESLHVNFDHLSIVSEENLTNSDGNSVQQNEMDSVASGTTVPLSTDEQEGGGYFTTDKKNSNRMSDIESLVPPLSHFENISYETVGPSLVDLEEKKCSTSTTTTEDTVIAANGWNFPVQPQESKTSEILNRSSLKLMTSSSLPMTQRPLLDTKVDCKSPKHFFSPIKPRLPINTGHSLSTNTFQEQNSTGPDIFVANVLASSSGSNQTPESPQKCRTDNDTEPLYSNVQESSSPSSKMYSESTFQTGGNLEELLMDIESLSKDIMQMQLKKQKSLSEDKLDTGTEGAALSNRNPYRSEMNLVLTYNGTNPVITPITKSTTSTSLTCGLGMSDSEFFSGTLDGESLKGTPPPPNVPEPMMLFPENRPYLGFENFGQPVSSLADGKPILSIFGKSSASSGSNKPPPLPPADFEINYNDTPLKNVKPVIGSKLLTSSREENKMENSKQLADKKLDKTKENQIGASYASEAANCDSSSGSESIVKRKSRRVSLLFKKTEDNTKNTEKGTGKNQKNKNEDNRLTNVSSVGTGSTAGASSPAISTITTTPTTETPSDQTTLLNNDNRRTTISTNNPASATNSPHSGRHRTNSGSASGHHYHHHHHGHHHHHQGRKMSQDSGKQLSKLQSTGSNGGAPAGSGITQQQQRSKNERRHSEGTVPEASATGCGNESGGFASAHSNALISGSGHHLGTGGRTRHDSYNDGFGGGTSISERNSNSLASSRESSTSLSTRSQRRKISISSHSGGKIPWCGCWGNGCL